MRATDRSHDGSRLAPRVFALGASVPFGERLTAELGFGLAPCEERRFEDGEFKLRPIVSVRGRDVYVIHALHGDAAQSVHDKLCRLLFFVGCLRDNGAERITAVLPYLAYGRKDRRTQPRDPLTGRYLAELCEAIGVERAVALEVHNEAAFENAFRCPTVHVEAHFPLTEALVPWLAGRDAVVVAPDAGGIKRADRLRQALSRRLNREVPLAFVEKYRSRGRVRGGALTGDVAGRTAIVVDDLISTGTTVRLAAAACREHGAEAVCAAAAHGVFAPGAEALFDAPEVQKLFVTDSVAPCLQDRWAGKVDVVSAAPLMARVVQALHENGSVSSALPI